MKTIKEMLHDIMIAKNWDCQRLATELKVDKSQVSRWLTGAIPKPHNMRNIEKLYKESVNGISRNGGKIETLENGKKSS